MNPISLERISLLECGELFAQISGAVYYAHSMHCDLKLENILLDKMEMQIDGLREYDKGH
ncbi:AIF_collapsed_G0010950.mRNA.1.CDS.1 [Saccharomyces cerevisiae]|nr:AIF_collapsed_G0010950.mRNA.1.CDS.1 [Saccharomyces cerevisiae]